MLGQFDVFFGVNNRQLVLSDKVQNRPAGATLHRLRSGDFHLYIVRKGSRAHSILLFSHEHL